MEYIRFLNLDYLFLFIYRLLTGRVFATIPEELISLWATIKIISLFVTLFLLTGIIYSLIRIYRIRKEEREELGTLSVHETPEERKNTRFERINELLASEHPSSWRQAIIDADVLLDEMVTVMGYHGESLGEKLKQIERSDFKTLDQAWEAHKVRNTVAHSGSDFILTHREARRVIDLYKQVFEEFFFI